MKQWVKTHPKTMIAATVAVLLCLGGGIAFADHYRHQHEQEQAQAKAKASKVSTTVGKHKHDHDSEGGAKKAHKKDHDHEHDHNHDRVKEGKAGEYKIMHGHLDYEGLFGPASSFSESLNFPSHIQFNDDELSLDIPPAVQARAEKAIRTFFTVDRLEFPEDRGKRLAKYIKNGKSWGNYTPRVVSRPDLNPVSTWRGDARVLGVYFPEKSSFIYPNGYVLYVAVDHDVNYLVGGTDRGTFKGQLTYRLAFDTDWNLWSVREPDVLVPERYTEPTESELE